MTLHRAHLPGSPSRNGLPERAGYAYGGSDKDTLTGDLAPARIAYDIEQAGLPVEYVPETRQQPKDTAARRASQAAYRARKRGEA